MGRYQLRSPSQPFALRLVFGLFEFFASLKLAVVLIFSAAAVLGAATVYESLYGTPAVQFGLYGSWWFTALNALLAVNIFSAAAIRYPWKRHQTGFVITHIGLLTLLAGCLLSRLHGIDAQMPIFEGGHSHRAYKDSQYFALAIHELGGAKDDEDSVPESTLVGHRVPFSAGPFNWSDYETLSFFPWHVAGRSQGLLFDRDGIQLELLDYYSDSELVQAPYVRLWLSLPRNTRMAADGTERQGPENWVPVEMRISRARSALYPHGVGQRESRGGGDLAFLPSGSDAATQAFLHSAPEGDLGKRGQVVLFCQGKPFRFLAEEKLDAGRFPLGETGLEVEVAAVWDDPRPDPHSGTDEMRLVEGAGDGTSASDDPGNPTIELHIFSGDEPAGRMLLFAEDPILNLPDELNGVYGAYWFDRSYKTVEQRMAGEGGSRIDILAGHDERLYYRYWNGREFIAVDELPTDGTAVDAFKMPIAQLRMYVDRFVPRETPGEVITPKPFNKATLPVAAFRAAQLRLTVDGNSEEFWLLGSPPDPQDLPPMAAEQHTVTGEGRMVTVMMPLESVELGLGVHLDNFEMKLDPGTSQPSHYSSYVKLYDRATTDGAAAEHATPDLANTELRKITMNVPIDVSDPTSGRSYRLFQESFMGPWEPQERVFEKFVGGTTLDKTQLYASVLTVNYDPGRGLKYLGSLLVVGGIATMFYMRAYFFKPRPDSAAAAVKSRDARRGPPQPVA